MDQLPNMKRIHYAVIALENAVAAGTRLRHELYQARTMAGLSGKQLADKIGYSDAHVFNAENGRVKVSAKYISEVYLVCERT